MFGMATHRSLNKLEFKAHMSIHNSVDVPESEVTPTQGFTRDRLGKRHLLTDEKGDNFIQSMRKKRIVLFFVFSLLGSGALFASDVDSQPAPGAKKGPNTQVSSNDPDMYSVGNWLNDRDNKPDGFSGLQAGSASLGFNEDGDPNVSTRF